MSDDHAAIAALDSLPYPVTSLGVDGTIRWLNAPAARNLSRPRDELVGTSVYDFFPDRAEATRQRIRQTVEAKAPQHFEAVVTLPDGTERYFDSMYCPTFDADGEVVAVQIVARDVTKERLVERDRSSSEELWAMVPDDLSMTTQRVEAILEHAPILVCVLELDMTIRYLNRVPEGYVAAELIGHSPLPMIVEDSRPAFRRAFLDAVENQRLAECETRDRNDTSWLVRFAPLVHDGHTRQVLACVLDVTELKRLQVELAHKQRNESLGRMASGIAHDFNNLLTVIMGHCEVIRRRLPPSHSADDLLDEIDRASHRAADICEQMLIYAGRDASPRELAELSEVIGELGSLTRAGVEAHVELTYDLAPDLPATRCGRAQLGQIVLNLVNNAADAVEERGRVHVATDAVTIEEPLVGAIPAPLAPGRYVRLRVADSGHGIPPSEQPRIFDPFYTTKHGGHGLGLSVVLGIVKRSRGAIRVESSAEGTTMSVFLEAVDQSQPDAPRAEPTWREGSGTVLVADDEPGIRNLVEATLRDAGYDVLTAVDGDDALRVLAAEGDRIDAILLDVTMPNRDGYATLAALRETHPELPVLLSSGRPVALEAEDAFLQVLPKPYRSAALLSALERALVRS